MPTTTDASELKTKKKSLFQVGEPLSGKTRALLTCPKQVWVADLDQNTGALEDAKPGEIIVTRFETKQTARITREQHRPQEANYILDFIDWMNRIYDLPEDKAPRTLAVDGLTVLSRKAMEFVLFLNNRKEPVFQDWGQAMAKIIEVVECGNSLPFTNFILNAHIETEIDKVVGGIIQIPDTIGKLAGQLGGMFDAVVWARKETFEDPQTKRMSARTMWLTVPDNFIKQAGVRNLVTPKLVEARWENIFPNVK